MPSPEATPTSAWHPATVTSGAPRASRDSTWTGTRRSRTVLSLLVTGALVALAGCGNNLDEQGAATATGSGECETGPLKLGVVLEVTGAAAALGVPERDAVKLAVERINAAGGVNGEDVEAVILDNQSREDQAAKHATQLINQDKVDVLIGSGRTGGSLAMRPIAERSQTPMISLGAGAKIIEDSEYVYKTPPSDSVVLKQLVNYMAEQGYKEIGLLRDSSAFGEGVAEAIDAAGADKGIKVTALEKFDPAATEFTAQLLSLKNAGTDANIVWGSSTSPALAVKAYRELGLQAPLLTSYGLAAASFLETAGPTANGVVLNGNKVLVTDDLPSDDPQKEVLTEFVSAFEQEYGVKPSPFAGYAWDAVNLATEAAEAGGSCRPGILTALGEIENHVGVTGVYDFTTGDHSGLGESPLVFLEVRDGEFELLEQS
jgi:branched-chain amino acid transport system substrate-binding protein